MANDKRANGEIVRLDRRSSVPRRGKQAAATIQAAENTKRAYDLRRAGISYREIAQTLGVSLDTAFHYVNDVLVETATLTTNLREEVRQLEIERLDSMLSGIWARASAGNERSVETVLKIMDRRSRLLGLDAPQRQESLVAAVQPQYEVSLSAREELKAKIEAMAERGAPS